MSNTDSNTLPFLERPDLSPFIVHLTRNTVEKDEREAFDNLVHILRIGRIWASGTEGFIKKGCKAACFMDVPLSSLKYVLNTRNTEGDKPRYEAYGVVLSKEWAYDHGIRPVLYLSNDEAQRLSIPEEEYWRVVELKGFDGKLTNWVHEREWRSNGSLRLPSELRAVLVRNGAEADRLRRLINRKPKEFKSIPQSIIPLTVLCQGLPF